LLQEFDNKEIANLIKEKSDKNLSKINNSEVCDEGRIRPTCFNSLNNKNPQIKR
jgi:hypothetical protein